MIYKAMFDAKSPTWCAYGRAVFVEAESFESAAQLAHAVAQADYPESRIEIYAMGDSTTQARDAFNEKKARYAAWLANNRAGVPNTRAVLYGG